MVALFEKIRKRIPDVALRTSVIAGFPGETEKDHCEAMEFIRKCAFASMHIFPYSIRPGTAAAEMPGHHTNAVKGARAKEAQSIANEMQSAYLESMVGKTLSVLFETEKDGLWSGHSGNYCEVCARGESLHGLVKNVHISSVSGKKLVGIVI